mgnify:CR=1 FL=1
MHFGYHFVSPTTPGFTVSLLAIIRRKAALDTANLALPPVLRAIRLLNNPDAIALAEGQIAGCVAVEVVHGSDILGMEGTNLLRWGRRWFLLACCRVG